jgi:hypothetical protein
MWQQIGQNVIKMSCDEGFIVDSLRGDWPLGLPG